MARPVSSARGQTSGTTARRAAASVRIRAAAAASGLHRPRGGSLGEFGGTPGPDASKKRRNTLFDISAQSSSACTGATSLCRLGQSDSVANSAVYPLGGVWRCGSGGARLIVAAGAAVQRGSQRPGDAGRRCAPNRLVAVRLVCRHVPPVGNDLSRRVELPSVGARTDSAASVNHRSAVVDLKSGA